MHCSPISLLVLSCLPTLTTPSAPPVAQVLGAPSLASSVQDELFGEVTEALQQRVARGAYHGVIALVEIDGERYLEEVHGTQNQVAARSMQLDTIFRIYSMTKPITVVAALLLMEQGLLELDDPVSKHLPDLAELTVGLERAPLEREMTVRDLMRHTSGLTYGIFANSDVDSLVREADLLNPQSDLTEMVRKLGKLPLKSQPGSGFEYSLSIDVLGALVEVVAKEPLARFMERRIFQPLGMRDTGFFVPADKLGRLADLNTRASGDLQPIPERPGLTELPKLQSGGGGLFSTLEDYLRFASMLLNEGQYGGQRLLSKQSVAMMTQNQMAAINPEGAYGLGGAVVSSESDSGPGLNTYSWGGLAGTDFWVDPSERIIGIFMIQNMGENQHSARFKQDVYEAIGR